MGSPTTPIVLIDALLTVSMVIFFTAVGFRFRVGRGQGSDRTGDAWLTTIGGRLSTSICLVGFSALLGMFFATILARFTGIPVPGFLGGMAMAVLVRSTTELTDEEFPARETNAIGWISLFGLLALFLAGRLLP